MRDLFRPALRKLPRALRALRTVAAELIQPRIEIGAVAAEAALGENGGDQRSLIARAQPVRIHDHAREARRQRQLT